MKPLDKRGPFLLKAVKASPSRGDTSGKGYFLISIMAQDKAACSGSIGDPYQRTAIDLRLKDETTVPSQKTARTVLPQTGANSNFGYLLFQL